MIDGEWIILSIEGKIICPTRTQIEGFNTDGKNEKEKNKSWDLYPSISNWVVYK